MLNKSSHPDINDLCDHFSVHGRKLSDAEKEEITAHLEICTDCKIIGEKIRIVDDAWQEASRKDFQEPPEVTALVQHMKDWAHDLCSPNDDQLAEPLNELATSTSVVSNLKVALSNACTWLREISLIKFPPGHLSFSSAEAPRFQTERPAIVHWENEGIICVLSAKKNGLVFAVDTKNEFYNGRLVSFSLVHEAKNEEVATGLLVLHPYCPGSQHYVAATVLNKDLGLSGDYRPHLDFVELDTSEPPDDNAILDAVSKANEDADRQAWLEWAQGKEKEGRLPKQIVDHINFVISDNKIAETE